MTANASIAAAITPKIIQAVQTREKLAVTCVSAFNVSEVSAESGLVTFGRPMCEFPAFGRNCFQVNNGAQGIIISAGGRRDIAVAVCCDGQHRGYRRKRCLHRDIAGHINCSRIIRAVKFCPAPVDKTVARSWQRLQRDFDHRAINKIG